MEKKGLTLEEFRAATAALGESIPLRFNGAKVHGVTAARDEAGNLEVHLLGEQEVAVAAEPAEEAATVDEVDAAEERRENDLSSLTEEEREELARLEKLGGVDEQRSTPMPDTGNEGDPL